VDAGGSIVGRHDGGEDFFGPGDGSRSNIRNLYVLLPDRSSSFLVQALLRLKAGPLLVSPMLGRMGVVETPLEADAEGVFLVSELVDKITSVAPEREARVGRGCVEGRPDAILIVVVEQISGILLARAC
jgi:hypothetical protein